MGLFDVLGKGADQLRKTVEQMVRQAIAFSVRQTSLGGNRAVNYFVLTVPSFQVEHVGLANIATLCRDTIASQTIDGRVAKRFVLVAEETPKRQWGLVAQALSDQELANRLIEDESRAASGLSLMLSHPQSIISIRPHWGAPIEFDQSFSFGRQSDNDLMIDVLGTGRHHGQVVYRGGIWELIDLSSTNGTSVNGRRVARATLAKGDVVSIVGRIAFTVDDLIDWTQPVADAQSKWPDRVKSDDRPVGSSFDGVAGTEKKTPTLTYPRNRGQEAMSKPGQAESTLEPRPDGIVERCNSRDGAVVKSPRTVKATSC